MVTGNIWLGFLEWLAHTTIGEANGEGEDDFRPGRSLAHRLQSRLASLPRPVRNALAWAAYLALVGLTFALASLMVADMSGNFERVLLLVICFCVVLAMIWMFWPRPAPWRAL
ncbi:hypothetical protein B5K03_09010 [Rhizobium phaseoli]|nr:hypothetical protein B5K03_09010 [Rhizobium phaseoli]